MPEQDNPYFDQARQAAAQCWCDEETQSIEMDTRLAEAFAKRLAVWMEEASIYNRNAGFYRSIIEEIGKMFGDAAKTSDDGSLQEDVLALRVPELVRDALEELKFFHRQRPGDC